MIENLWNADEYGGYYPNGTQLLKLYGAAKGIPYSEVKRKENTDVLMKEVGS